jgi:uncharacterized membrane protein HdeD (DUF308 family)
MTDFSHPIYYVARRWWIFLLFGVLFLAGGIWVFLHAEDRLMRIDTLLRYIILGLGAAQLLLSLLFQRENTSAWWSRIVGLLEIGIGLYLILVPGKSVYVLAAIIALWLLVRGLFLIEFAFQFRKVAPKNWFWTLVGGAVMVLLTLFIIRNPLEEEVTAFFWVALNMVLAGIFHILLSFKLQYLNRRRRRAEKNLPAAEIEI